MEYDSLKATAWEAACSCFILITYKVYFDWKKKTTLVRLRRFSFLRAVLNSSLFNELWIGPTTIR